MLLSSPLAPDNANWSCSVIPPHDIAYGSCASDLSRFESAKWNSKTSLYFPLRSLSSNKHRSNYARASHRTNSYCSGFCTFIYSAMHSHELCKCRGNFMKISHTQRLRIKMYSEWPNGRILRKSLKGAISVGQVVTFRKCFSNSIYRLDVPSLISEQKEKCELFMIKVPLIDIENTLDLSIVFGRR